MAILPKYREIGISKLLQRQYDIEAAAIDPLSVSEVDGWLFTKLIKPKQITTKKFTITYLSGTHSDWIIVKDKFGKEILSFSNKNDKLGIDYIRYAKY